MALILASAALAVAVGSWLSSGNPKNRGASAEDAHTLICSAQERVRAATGINTSLTNPDPANKATALGIAANARLALFAGGTYLDRLLTENPNTPADLAGPVAAMADTLQSLGINYLAGAAATDSVQQPLRDNLKDLIIEIDGLC